MENKFLSNFRFGLDVGPFQENRDTFMYKYNKEHVMRDVKKNNITEANVFI